MLHLAYWWLYILLHRPFYRRARSDNGSEKDIDHVKVSLACILRLPLLMFQFHA